MQNNDSYSESCLTLHTTVKFIKPGISSVICDDNNEWQSFIKKQLKRPRAVRYYFNYIHKRYLNYT